MIIPTALTTVSNLLPGVPNRKAIDRYLSESSANKYGTRLFTLITLFWQYVETVLNLCILHRIPETKSLVRRTRELRHRYDSFRSSWLSPKYAEIELNNADRFYDVTEVIADRFFTGMKETVSKMNLTPESALLVIAVHQAMAVGDAVKIYSRDIDKMFESLGAKVPAYCLVQSEVLEVLSYLPQFAGDCFQSGLESQRETGEALADALRSI